MNKLTCTIPLPVPNPAATGSIFMLKDSSATQPEMYILACLENGWALINLQTGGNWNGVKGWEQTMADIKADFKSVPAGTKIELVTD